MTRHAVERLVILSAAGVGESWRQVPLLVRVLFRMLLRNIHADHTAQEALVRTSSMDWTIVRAAILTADPALQQAGHRGHILALPVPRMSEAGL